MSQTTELLLRIRQIGGEQLQQLGRSLNKLGQEATNANQDFRTLAVQLKNIQSSSANSINNLRGYANAWQQIANSVEIGSAEFKQATAEAAKLDAQLAKTQGRRAGAGRLGGIAQTVGTIAGAGVFGGPEGALGALLGSAGGVPGAITGGAIGAQVGQLRQLLGSTADYVAEIRKLQIALQGVAGSQSEYASALRVADQATRQLNVPQEVAIQGMTKLTAAVKGAGGQVRDAGVVFTNITKAIKGTGGSAEDVQGAITAMVQVFSKGKVSAEELSGQLGERLPGAVTLFAKANKMTLPELQKGLKEGQIGLNELMRFIELLGTEYGMTALKIAASSEDAGARLRVSFNDMRLAVGAALQPIGAELQATFAQFIQQITPAIVVSAKLLGGALLGLTKVLDDLVFGLTVFGSTVATIKVLGFVAGLQNATTASVVLAGAIGIIETRIKQLALSLLAIPGWGWVAAGITALALLAKALYDNNEDFRNWVNGVTSVVTNDFRAAMRQLGSETEAGIRNAASYFQAFSDYVAKIASDIAGKFAGLGKSIGLSGKDAANMWSGALQAIKNNVLGLFQAVGIAISRLYSALPAPLRKFIDQPSAIKDIGKVAQYLQGVQVRAGAVKPSAPAKPTGLDLTGVTSFAGPQGDGGAAGGEKKAKTAKEILDISIAELNIRKQLAELDSKANPVQEAYLNYKLQILKIDEQIRKKQIGIRDAEIQRIEAKDKLNEAIDEERKRGIDALLEIDRLTKQQAISLEDVKAQYGLITKEAAEQLKFDREIAKLREGAKGTRLIEETEEVIRKLIEAREKAKTFGAQLAVSFADGVKSMGELSKNLGQSLATAFGGLADVVAEFVATGKASFADFTRSVLADLTKIFVRAAFFYTLKSILPGGSFLGKLFALEKGGIMTGDGPMQLKRYANGGIANSPQLAMFGEGSRPEAYVPLPDGRSIPVTMQGGGQGVNVVVNVDAKGTDVQGNGPNAKALGTVVSSAVQAEILKQQRPGGLLSGSR